MIILTKVPMEEYLQSGLTLVWVKTKLLCDRSWWTVKKIVLVIIHRGVKSFSGFFSFESGLKSIDHFGYVGVIV